MSMFDWLFGSDDKLEQFDTMSPEQKQTLSQLFSHLQGMNPNISQDPLYQQGRESLSDMINPSQESFDKFSEPYMRMFEQQVMPSITNRFADSSNKGSSGFQNAVSQAGGNLTSGLAAMMEQRKMEAINSALGYAQQPVTNYSALMNTAMGKEPFRYGITGGHRGLIDLIAPFMGGFTGGFR